MALTKGTGPFGERHTGRFNFDYEAPGHVIYIEDSPRLVSVRFNGEIVARSDRMKLLHETAILPVYYFPADDVNMEFLEPTEHSTHCPFKGDAGYWSIVVGEETSVNAAWSYKEPFDSVSDIKGHIAFYWHKVDSWHEEDEEIFVHARDPYHRVDVLESSRHVRVSLDGEVLAETNKPVLLFESGLPTRYYLDPKDVRAEFLVPTNSTTQCPYKGTATYHSVNLGNEIHDDLIWYYKDPIEGVYKIKGRLAFYNERVDIEVDGVKQERPITAWSPKPK